MSLSVWLLSIPQGLSALLVVGFFILFGVGIILAVRRWIPPSRLKPHNDIAGFVFATLGVIYGVMLAFVVIDVWEQYDNAKEITDQESSGAFALYRDLSLYPNRAEADMAIAELRAFTHSVVHEEFPAMQTMKWESRTQASLATQKASNRMSDAVRRIIPQNLHEQALFSEILKDVNSMAQYRVKRLLAARSDLPGVVWVVVVLGGLILLGFIALFGHENMRVHLILAVLLGTVTGGVIFVIVSLNFPFTGPVSIQPEGYEFLIELAGW